ncbi:secoisolariciresinol dehydrogenase-like [Phoenix dactylifera]|uniref:Secoisolariciresinol dehydrogenase-like n=1 Tax=Phoenix dactylifera TaxID=42345 RepID=A0A8B7CGX9_PHODC|nr:secoisolariciresinol dehydrogenase-like [Phoenix dactylifera]
MTSALVKRLEGKVAVITGGASGIGECTARLFSQHGAKVVVADIQDERGRSVCDTIGATFVHCDVTKESDVQKAIDTAVTGHGKLDIMFNNAGIIDAGKPITDTALSDFHKVIDVIVTGAFLGTKHAARVMVPAGRGSIISTASVASVIGGVGTHAYTAAKHAVAGLTRSAAVELGRFGVRVNCVSPYAVATRLAVEFARIDEKVFEEAMSKFATLQGTLLKPEDVAMAVLYLASDESKYVSGHNLMVDGGYSIVNRALLSFDPSDLASS